MRYVSPMAPHASRTEVNMHEPEQSVASFELNLSGFKNNFFLISLERKIDSTVFPAVTIILNCLQHTIVVKLINGMME